MFSLSLREQILVAAILVAVVLGVSVKHWRDAHRELAGSRPPAPAGAAASTLDFPPVARTTPGRPQHP